MIGGDARGREFERIAQGGGNAFERGAAFGGRNCPAADVQVVPVEALGIVRQRRVAARAHGLEDRSDIARDIFISLAARIDQGCEGGGEVGRGGGEALGHDK